MMVRMMMPAQLHSTRTLAESTSTVKKSVGRLPMLSAPSLLGEARAVLKKPSRHSPKDEAANVGQVGYSARAHVRYRADAKELHDKSYPDQERCGDKCETRKKEEK
jgi:hypothetical protein